MCVEILTVHLCMLSIHNLSTIHQYIYNYILINEDKYQTLDSRFVKEKEYYYILVRVVTYDIPTYECEINIFINPCSICKVFLSLQKKLVQISVHANWEHMYVEILNVQIKKIYIFISITSLSVYLVECIRLLKIK